MRGAAVAHPPGSGVPLADILQPRYRADAALRSVRFRDLRAAYASKAMMIDAKETTAPRREHFVFDRGTNVSTLVPASHAVLCVVRSSSRSPGIRQALSRRPCRRRSGARPHPTASTSLPGGPRRRSP